MWSRFPISKRFWFKRSGVGDIVKTRDAELVQNQALIHPYPIVWKSLPPLTSELHLTILYSTSNFFWSPSFPFTFRRETCLPLFQKLRPQNPYFVPQSLTSSMPSLLIPIAPPPNSYTITPSRFPDCEQGQHFFCFISVYQAHCTAQYDKRPFTIDSSSSLLPPLAKLSPTLTHALT